LSLACGFGGRGIRGEMVLKIDFREAALKIDLREAAR